MLGFPSNPPKFGGFFLFPFLFFDSLKIFYDSSVIVPKGLTVAEKLTIAGLTLEFVLLGFILYC